MSSTTSRRALFVVLALVGCSTATRQSVGNTGTLTPAAQAKADGGREPYTSADVRFMQGMIHHHAQAVVMSRLAPSRRARADVRVLAERIDVAQRDEIAFMQEWLRERGRPVPDPLAHQGHQMATSDSLMPGMLTPEQMKQLDAARGAEFDRLFLAFMIQHHEGALTMTQQLLSSHGAAQDTYVWKFVSDVEADQSTEIERMQKMLALTASATPPPEGRRP